MFFNPLSDWNKVEKYFFSLVQGKLKGDYETKYRTKEFEFLSDIDFVSYIGNPITITNEGHKYYTLKYVDKNNDAALDLLSKSVKKLSIVQGICQQFYSKDNITKDQVNNLMLPYGYDKDNFSFDADSFLAFLDMCKILRYKKGKVEILYNPKAKMTSKPQKESKEIKTISINPDTPYTNKEQLRSIFRAAKNHIWWCDKHFREIGFPPLAATINRNSIKEILVLTCNDNITNDLKDDYERFKVEMDNKGVKAELRVLDPTFCKKIHDRWVIVDGTKYNLPPIKAIIDGQYSEINLSEGKNHFEEWWDQGKELVSNWDEIIITKKQKQDPKSKKR